MILFYICISRLRRRVGNKYTDTRAGYVYNVTCRKLRLIFPCVTRTDDNGLTELSREIVSKRRTLISRPQYERTEAGRTLRTIIAFPDCALVEMLPTSFFYRATHVQRMRIPQYML